MNIVVFEDAGTSQLFPITTGKPAYAISCASFRLIDWLSEFGGNLIGMVRPHLETLQLHDFSELQHQLSADFPETWLINARLVPSVSNIQRLHQFKDEYSSHDGTVVAQDGWAIASALIPTSRMIDKSHDETRALIADLAMNGTSETKVVESKLELFEFPHEVIEQNAKCFHENLAQRIALGNYREHERQVYVGSNVQLGQHVVFDTGGGPIVIDQNVRLGPHSFFRGPIYIGPNSKVSEHAAIKDEVSIAHTCKIGGEVEASVIEPYSNKQHHGFLGHSYLGSWINLGAGTCNSDLKNTYGTVNMQYGDRKVSTGMQFLGCVIGDYAKTAINTSIFTGKLIGTGSMVYGFATTNVPSFVNYARSFGEIGNLPPEVIVSTQARMFARRNVTQRPCDVQLIHDMYRATEFERPAKLSDEPLSL
jgi:UDP-N-acetylglucosamine diphosphorylase/glucosamine-1-phosphate N-acetyltransferase